MPRKACPGLQMLRRSHPLVSLGGTLGTCYGRDLPPSAAMEVDPRKAGVCHILSLIIV